LRGEGEVSGFLIFRYLRRFWNADHLTLPLLRNGPRPLPHFVAEKEREGGV